MPVLALENVTFRWPKQQQDCLHIEQLRVESGEHLFIKGASGSGKTTLLNVLTGILKPQQGNLSILGQSLQTMSAAQRDRLRADHMGVIFQQFNLLPYLSVIDNVQLPCHFSALRRQKVRGAMLTMAEQLLAQLGLDKALYKRSATKLSVGQQQRVAVARALIGQPELIIADEPTSALDADTRDQFMRLLFQQAETQASTIIFVSHDPQLARYFPTQLDLNTINRATERVTAL